MITGHMKYFIAIYNNAPIKGQICVEGDRVFLCQNTLNGARCYDTLGYKYSYCVGNDLLHLKEHYIEDFEIISFYND